MIDIIPYIKDIKESDGAFVFSDNRVKLVNSKEKILIYYLIYKIKGIPKNGKNINKNHLTYMLKNIIYLGSLEKILILVLAAL